MSELFYYTREVLARANQPFVDCEVFAKVLTRNDDSGRHGVVIPIDAYPFFPEFLISDPSVNETLEFSVFNSLATTDPTLAYKYYERYPERRITRLPGVLNSIDAARILVFLRAKDSYGTVRYCFDCANSLPQGRFDELFRLIFGSEVQPVPGRFIIRSVDSSNFSADDALTELLERFDSIKESGWIDSLRVGDTGIGYTFETLMGIEENNDQTADFHGIEIKCRGIREGASPSSGKLNLFQAGPTWLLKATNAERIRVIGKAREDGLFACFSQVTTSPNNLGLLLDILHENQKIDLLKNADALGYWSFAQLSQRLAEKHSRAAFVKAKVRNGITGIQYSYEELVYCDQPSIDRFVDLVANRNIVFEFAMSERSIGRVRNHGYPWRLIREEFLDRLFAFQIKLR